jgi:toxin ParE1/3/4
MLRLKSTIETVVAQNLRVGRLRPELGQDIRSFPVLPYVIFYRLEGPIILIERILHGHRDISGPITSLLLVG